MANKNKNQIGAKWYQLHGEFISRMALMLVFVAIVLFVIVVSFHVHDFHVTGNSMYTAEEIQEATGLELGENIVLLSKSNVASSILANLPYVESVRVTRQLPSTILVEITEATAFAAIQSDTEEWWLISTEGKLLEEIDQAQAQEYLRIIGVNIDLPEAGEKLDVGLANDAIIEILAALEALGLDHCTILDLNDLNGVVLWYAEQFQIWLGDTQRLTYKLQFFNSILQSLGDDYEGAIDLTFSEDDAAHFHPW